MEYVLVGANRSFQEKALFDEALHNLGYDYKVAFSQSDIAKLQFEMDGMTLCNGELQDFIGDIPNNDQLESLDGLDSDAKYAAMARNLSRYLIRGVAISRDNNTPISESPFYQSEIIDSFLKQRDPKLFAAWRKELQMALTNIYKILINEKLTPGQEQRYQMFLDIILSTYPFIDPEERQIVNMPIKQGQHWRRQKFHFDKLDISPQTGILANLLEDEDRIYAYGLVPEDQSVTNSLLIFMGTTYPAGQGSDLANIYNFYPRHSVGEAHDMTQVKKWLQGRQNVTVMGHSKGATMAMVAAASFHEITKANCFNPAPLASATLSRLEPIWQLKRQTSQINVYSQKGDPVSYIGKGFLPGTNVFRIIAADAEPGINSTVFGYKIPSFLKKILLAYERHISYVMGRKKAIVINGSAEKMSQSLTREFLDDLKSVLDYLLFPFQYMSKVVELILRKPIRWYRQNLMRSRIAVMGLVATAFLVTAGIALLNPAFAALILSLGMGVLTSSQTLGLIGGLSLAVTVASPFILEFAKLTLEVTLKLAHAVITSIVGLGATAIFGVKAGINSYRRSNSVNSYALINERLAEVESPSNRSQNIIEEAYAQPLLSQDNYSKEQVSARISYSRFVNEFNARGANDSASTVVRVPRPEF